MGMHHGICKKLRQIMDVLFKEFSGLGFIGRQRVMGRKPKTQSKGAKKIFPMRISREDTIQVVKKLENAGRVTEGTLVSRFR